jgi:hypothetical protein
MPKVISRSIVVTDDAKRAGGDKDDIPLLVHYCVCGHLALILGMLEHMLVPDSSMIWLNYSLARACVTLASFYFCLGV